MAKPIAPTAEQMTWLRLRLVERDPALAEAHAATPPLEWRTRPGGFAGLFRMIVEQQVSVASADAVWRRLNEGMGAITPDILLAHDAEALRGFGLSRQKSAYGHGLARAQRDGMINLEGLSVLDDAEAIAALVALKGVGLWTAEVYLMMCEGRLDVFPGGDVALQEAMRWADRAQVRPDQKAAYARAEPWRPYRGVASHLLWAWYGGVKSGAIVRETA